MWPLIRLSTKTFDLAESGRVSANALIPLWYGVIFMVNMQMAFLSPPFGYSLFYLKSVAPPEISMATIFRSSVNFMALQWIGVGLCILFPQIVTWLPSLLYAR